MVLLFGSRVKENYREDSDFDIAYTAKKQLSVDEKISLNTELTRVFENDRVDTVDLRQTDDPILIYEVARNCKLLFGDEEELARFKMFAFRYYMDHKPLFKVQSIIARKNQERLNKIIHGEK